MHGALLGVSIYRVDLSGRCIEETLKLLNLERGKSETTIVCTVDCTCSLLTFVRPLSLSSKKAPCIHCMIVLGSTVYIFWTRQLPVSQVYVKATDYVLGVGG